MHFGIQQQTDATILLLIVVYAKTCGQNSEVTFCWMRISTSNKTHPNYGRGAGWRTMHHGNLREVNNKRHQLSTESNNIILIWPSKVTQDRRKCHGSTHRVWFPITVPWSYLALFPTYSQILVENREIYISVFNSPVLSDPVGILQTWLVQNGRLEWFDYHRPEESMMMWTLR